MPVSVEEILKYITAAGGTSVIAIGICVLLGVKCIRKVLHVVILLALLAGAALYVGKYLGVI